MPILWAFLVPHGAIRPIRPQDAQIMGITTTFATCSLFGPGTSEL